MTFRSYRNFWWPKHWPIFWRAFCWCQQVDEESWWSTQASLTLLNFWDVGVNRAVFEMLSKVAGKFQNLLLLNVLSLEKDCDDLYKPPYLGDTYPEGRCSLRGDDKRLMALLTSLHYFVRCVFLTNCEPQSTIVVGTHADKFHDATECS